MCGGDPLVVSPSLILSALLIAKCVPDPITYEGVPFKPTFVEGPPAEKLLAAFDPLFVVATADGVDVHDLHFRLTRRITPTSQLARQFNRDRRRVRHSPCGGTIMSVSPGVYQTVGIADAAESRTSQLEIDANRMHAMLTLETPEGPVRIHYRGLHGCALAGGDAGALALLPVVIVFMRRRRRS